MIPAIEGVGKLMQRKMYYRRIRLIAYMPFSMPSLSFPPRIPTPDPTPLVYYYQVHKRPLRKILLLKQEEHRSLLDFKGIV